jgi:hypothetical protein
MGTEPSTNKLLLLLLLIQPGGQRTEEPAVQCCHHHLEQQQQLLPLQGPEWTLNTATMVMMGKHQGLNLEKYMRMIELRNDFFAEADPPPPLDAIDLSFLKLPHD